MNVDEVMEILSNEFKVEEALYKTEEHREKYGTSFSAVTDKEFVMLKVNDLTFKAKRVIEEFGEIIFIYNFSQVQVKKEDIRSIELLKE